MIKNNTGMKTESRRMRNVWMGALLLWLAFAPLAQAFYNPSTGKWLNREPLGDEAFLTSYSARMPKGEKARLHTVALKPPYLFVSNDSIQGTDLLGLENCYMYCTGFPEGEPGLRAHRRGAFPNRCFRPYTCAKLKSAAVADGLEWIPKGGKCKDGWTKIAFFEGDMKGVNYPKPDDFHFACQDADGNWSQKRGELGKPETIDAGGKAITDPESADMNYPKIKYKKCDGYLCAPPKKPAK